MDRNTEVVISGAAGVFPECKGIPELEDALFRKAHLITDDHRKWKQNYDIPTYCGKAFSAAKFDAIFFNIHYEFPSSMDPIMRQALETCTEAIIDAGVNPKTLAGTRTAVYSAYESSESELALVLEDNVNTARELNALAGTYRAYSANRLSFGLNFVGPSHAFQGSHGVFFKAIQRAKSELEEGLIPAAVVVCMNSIQTARTLAILDGMGLAAHDGKCRPFDQRAQGYAVSDCCAAFFLQRATDARRNWATIIGADYRYFGNKKGGLLDFDGQPAKEMLRQLYAEWNVDPESIGYIEADGSGIKEQDLEEVDVISEIFCRNRKEPMLIGSVKSNMGHAQSAACGAGMVKALIALNKSRIPPTIHCDSPIPELSLKGLK